METSELEEKVYEALKENQPLMDLLAKADKSIFHLRAPEVYPDLPFLVYSPTSDVPVLHGDNLEEVHRVIFRIHIITGDIDYTPIYKEVKKVMAALDFTRSLTTPFIDKDGVRMLITDFKIIIGG